MELKFPIRVSSSEIETYRQCRLKHQIQYVERWRTDEEAEALGRGTLFHSVMEAHYGALLDSDDPMDEVALYAAVSPLLYDRETGEQSERQELVEWMYKGYVQKYDVDRSWEVVDIELPLEQPLLNPDGTESGFVLSGTCDLIVRDKTMDGLWIVDHKTCKYLPKKDFDLEDQTAVYTLLLRRQGIDIRGAIYNHVRSDRLKTKETPMEDRFKRSITVRTNQELATCADEFLTLMQEAYAPFLNRPNDAPAFDRPRTPDGERCGWKCNLTEPCLAGRKYGPERMRTFLEDTGFSIKETKPGPTFNKEVSR